MGHPGDTGRAGTRSDGHWGHRDRAGAPRVSTGVTGTPRVGTGVRVGSRSLLGVAMSSGHHGPGAHLGWPLWDTFGAQGPPHIPAPPRAPPAPPIPVPSTSGQGRRCPSRWIACPGGRGPAPRGPAPWGCQGMAPCPPLAPVGQWVGAGLVPAPWPGHRGGQGHCLRVYPPPSPTHPSVTLTQPRGSPSPTDLLELAGLVVLGSLQEVEQDDVAQHRALGRQRWGGQGALWGTLPTPHSPPWSQAGALLFPHTARLCVHPPPNCYGASPSPCPTPMGCSGPLPSPLSGMRGLPPSSREMLPCRG